jgi:hypothetical protein
VDNSASMAGRPLREARRAARDFLFANGLAGTTGVVAFGHEALSLTRPGQSRSDVANALQAISADTQRGTALYDAVALSAARLERMTHGTRVLVLLTDRQDVGSKASLSRAIAAAQGGERRRLFDHRRHRRRQGSLGRSHRSGTAERARASSCSALS